MADDLLPVEKQLHVRLPPVAAFDLFTRDLSSWWPFATHSCAGADAVRARFAGAVGAQVIEEDRHGGRHPWGTLLAWEPPHRFSMTWHPGSDPARATRLEVRFTAADDGGTIVRLRHDGWTARPDGAEARGNYDRGWDLVLGRYEALSAGVQR